MGGDIGVGRLEEREGWREGDVGRQVGVRGVDSTRDERWIGMRCRYMGWGDWRRLGQEEIGAGGRAERGGWRGGDTSMSMGKRDGYMRQSIDI